MRQHYFATPFANAGDRAAVPVAAPGDGTVSYTLGFGPFYQLDLATNPSALAMPRDKDNQIKYDITLALQSIQQGTPPEWITAADNNAAAFPYAYGARTYYSDNVGVNPFYTYVSIATANTATPLTDATKWRRENPFGDIPSLGGALTSGGAANVQTLTPAIPIDAYQPYVVYEFLAGFTNSAGLTLNVSGLGAKSVFCCTPAGIKACVGGEVVAGNMVRVRYDGTRFLLLSMAHLQLTGAAGTTGYVLTSNADGSASWTGYTGDVSTNLVRAKDPTLSGQVTIANGAITGMYTNGAAVSGTWYTAIPAAVFNSASGGVGLWLIYVASQNQAGAAYILSVPTTIAPGMTLTLLAAGVTAQAQVDGANNLQVRQTGAGVFGVSAYWFRMGQG